MRDTTTAHVSNTGGLYILRKEVRACVRSNAIDSELDIR